MIAETSHIFRLFIVGVLLFITAGFITLSAQETSIIPKTKKEIERENTFAAKERKKITSARIASITKTLYQYKYGATEKTGTPVSITKYDRNGYRIEETELNPLDGSMKTQKKYRYDTKGNLIEETRIESNNIYKTTHRYNSENLKVESIIYKNDGSIDKKISYLYDNNGVLLEVKGFVSDGREYLHDSYYYDMNGRLIELKSNLNKFTYTYDDRGYVSCVSKYTRYFKVKDSVQYSLLDYYLIDHDQDDNLTGMAHYGSDSTMKTRLQYILDDDGNLVKEKEYNYNNAVVFERTLVHDKNGNLTEERGNDHGRKFRNVYKYDSKGNAIESISYDQINEPFQMTKFVFARYGRNNNPSSSDEQALTVNSSPIAEFDDSFFQLIGCRIIAPDGTYLGVVVADTVDPQSIINVFGKYGSENSSTSIFNTASSYGGTNGIFSPYNDLSPSPPAMYKDGKFVNYLTDNDNFRPRTSPQDLVKYLLKRSKKHQ